MNWLFFFSFLILTLALIWNDNNLFNKKQWISMGLMLGLVLLSTAGIGFLLKWLALTFSIFPVAVAKTLLHHLINVSPVRLGYEIYRRFAMHNIFWCYGGA